MNWGSIRFVGYLIAIFGVGGFNALQQKEPTWAWISVVVAGLGAVASFLETSPATNKKVAQLTGRVADLTASVGKSRGPGGSGLAMLCIVGALAGGSALVVGAGATVTACTPAQQAELGTLETIVLQDIAAGKNAEAIQEDIVKTVCPANVSTACVDGVIVLNDVLQGLIDLGVIPANLLPKARAIYGEVHPVAMAHRTAAGGAQ